LSYTGGQELWIIVQGSNDAMMKVWGMLSPEDEEAGFDLVMDDDWYVVLLSKNKTIARFDPRDYTASELHSEVETILSTIRGEPDGVC